MTTRGIHAGRLVLGILTYVLGYFGFLALWPAREIGGATLDAIVRVFVVPLTLGFLAAVVVNEMKRDLYVAVAVAPFLTNALRIYRDDVPFEWVVANAISGLATVSAIAVASVLGAYLYRVVTNRHGHAGPAPA